MTSLFVKKPANSLKEALVSNGITPNEQGIFYYDLPLVKDNIHRVSVVSVDGEVSEEKTLKILEESSVNTVVISKSYVSSGADIKVELLKNNPSKSFFFTFSNMHP